MRLREGLLQVDEVHIVMVTFLIEHGAFFLQLVVDIDAAFFHVHVISREAAERGNTKSGSQEYHNLVIILTTYTVCLEEIQQTFFLLCIEWGLCLGIVHDDFFQVEIEGILMNIVIFHGSVKDSFQFFLICLMISLNSNLVVQRNQTLFKSRP